MGQYTMRQVFFVKKNGDLEYFTGKIRVLLAFGRAIG